jgi:hypothetical protein
MCEDTDSASVVSLKAAVESYLRAKTLSRETSNEYRSTARKWEQWGGGPPIEAL